jgi:hypothetical protein
VNPNACSASKALDEWLDSEGIGGGSISENEMFCIEASEPEPLTQIAEPLTQIVEPLAQIEEVEDSEATSDSEDEQESAQCRAASGTTIKYSPPFRTQLLFVTVAGSCRVSICRILIFSV